jgi:hypothetical protein
MQTKISPKRGNRYDHLKQVLYKKKKALGADAKASKFEEFLFLCSPEQIVIVRYVIINMMMYFDGPLRFLKRLR